MSSERCRGARCGSRSPAPVNPASVSASATPTNATTLVILLLGYSALAQEFPNGRASLPPFGLRRLPRIVVRLGVRQRLVTNALHHAAERRGLRRGFERFGEIVREHADRAAVFRPARSGPRELVVRGGREEQVPVGLAEEVRRVAGLGGGR